MLTINATTGKASVIGPAHSELFGLGDLVTVANDQFYYLGDTAAGATLVALNLTTGAEICTQHVDVATIKFVGIGQSLDHDAVTGSLVLSGVASNLSSGTHSVYRAPDVGCGSMTHVGHFGLANYLPSIHSSSFDAKGQRLFVTVATNKSTTAIGILDLTSGNMSVVPEGAAAPNLHDTITGMHWDVGTQMLLGVMPSSDDSTLQLHEKLGVYRAEGVLHAQSTEGDEEVAEKAGGARAVQTIRAAHAIIPARCHPPTAHP